MRQAEPQAVSPGIVFLPPVRCPQQVNFLEMGNQVTGKGSGNLELPSQTLLLREIQGRERGPGRWGWGGGYRERMPAFATQSLSPRASLVISSDVALLFFKDFKILFLPQAHFFPFPCKRNKRITTHMFLKLAALRKGRAQIHMTKELQPHIPPPPCSYRNETKRNARGLVLPPLLKYTSKSSMK